MVDILRELDSNPFEWTDSYGKEAYSPTLEPVDSDSNWKVPEGTNGDNQKKPHQSLWDIRKDRNYSIKLKKTCFASRPIFKKAPPLNKRRPPVGIAFEARKIQSAPRC